MKKINTILLATLFAIIANLAVAQAPVKQYCGGTNGSVTTPSNALGNDLSDYSTLKLRSPHAKKDHVYQNFIFSPDATRGTRVTFVIQTDMGFDPKKVTDLNLKFYTSDDGIHTDTLTTEDLQITCLDEAIHLYEFSFISDGNFDTTGIMLQGGGIFRVAKIYKVSLTANKIASSSLVTTKK